MRKAVKKVHVAGMLESLPQGKIEAIAEMADEALQKCLEFEGHVSPLVVRSVLDAFAKVMGGSTNSPVAPAELGRTFSLEELKADPRARLSGMIVRIWSREHGAFWRENGAGYASSMDGAGAYAFEDAWNRTRHCGPEKGIEYVVVGSGNKTKEGKP